MDERMSDTESEYLDYEHAKDNEGGPHLGRSDPSTKMLWSAAIAIGILAAGIAALLLLR